MNASPSLGLGDIKVRRDARQIHRAFMYVVCPLLRIYVILLRSAALDSVYSRHVLLKLTQTRQHMTGLSNKGKHAINTARDHVTGIVQMNWYRTYSGRGAPWCFHSQAARGRCMGHGNHYYLTPTRRSHSPPSSLSQQPPAATPPS